MPEYKIVHYINQFFANIGGEEKADIAPEKRDGVVGPGAGLDGELKKSGIEAKIIGTVICGDSYFNENLEKAKKEVLERRISSQAEELLENRMRFSKGEGDKNSVYPLEGVDKASCVFSPVIVNGDIIGGITVLESDSNEKHSPSVEKVCELAAEFLTKQMEE